MLTSGYPGQPAGSYESTWFVNNQHRCHPAALPYLCLSPFGYHKNYIITAGDLKLHIGEKEDSNTCHERKGSGSRSEGDERKVNFADIQ